MKYGEWLDYLSVCDFDRINPDLLVYYILKDPDLSGYEVDNLRNYTYSKKRYEDICRNLSCSLQDE